MILAAAVCVPRGGVAQAAPNLERTTRLAAAEQALAQGKAFQATQVLAPLLGAPATRDPATVLLAARAAAGWEGWGSVVRLLAQQPWLDALAGGEGRALLARARVERGEPAVDDARRAAAAAGGEAMAPRLVVLARAFDRARQLDSAALYYQRAAELLPLVGDWLRLRAAGVSANSAARGALLRGVSLPAAVPRIRWTEALARDRGGDWREAARLYERLGATLAAARISLRETQDAGELATVRRELVALLTPRVSVEDARDAIALLDAAFPKLSGEEELVVARCASAAEPARAAMGFARAARAHRLLDADKLSYGSALARLGRHREAMALLATIRSKELRAQVQYLRARSLLASGARSEAIAALRGVAVGFPPDSATVASAGYLAGDLLVAGGADEAGRQAYLEVARRFPRTSHGPRAALQAALIAWVRGDRAAAGTEFAGLAERAGESSEGVAALYWSGRALAAAGDSAGATARWRSLLDRFPASYYTVPAAERLGVSAVREPPPVLSAPADSSVSASLDRASLLERLGLRVEARFEYELLSRQAESNAGMLLGTARAFFERGLTGRGYRLALRAAEPTPQRLAFPLPSGKTMEEAREAGLDPLLVASLIRQESAFDPNARSRADARGLMQVLPSVGAGLAPASGIGLWDPALLYQPDINIHFGVAHLAQMLRRYSGLPVALAAYNAGGRAASRWLALPGAAQDPEVYIERIQFLETRDYVRRVLRNLAVYRVLYPPAS